MTLIKTSLLNGVAVLVRVGTALVLNKVLAVYVGPLGYALIGQVQSMVAVLMGIASGAIGTGVTKYTAEYHDKPDQQMTVWQTAVAMGLIGSTLGAVVLVAGREPLAKWLLQDVAYANVFLWLALSLVLMVANGLMLAILNGLNAIKFLVLANIGGSLIGATVSLGLVLTQGLYGALVALGLGQAAACVMTAFIFRKVLGVRWLNLLSRFDSSVARRLMLFGLMAIVSSIFVPLSQMVIRDQLGSILGAEVAGLWQAMWRISDMHLMLITSTLTVYFLPRFSALPPGPVLRREVLHAYKFVLPLILFTSTSLYLFRNILIRGMLTDDFSPLADALGWQLAGDAIKICSWVAGITLISHARIGIFMITEVIFSCLLVVFSILGGYYDGLTGTAIGYAASYLLHFVTMTCLLFLLAPAKKTENKL